MRNGLLICLGASVLLPLFVFGAEPEARRGPRDILWRLRQGNLAYVAGRQKAAQATPARRCRLRVLAHVGPAPAALAWDRARRTLAYAHRMGAEARLDRAVVESAASRPPGGRFPARKSIGAQGVGIG